MVVSRGPMVLVGRSVDNSPGRARSPVIDGTRSWAGPWLWQDPEGSGYWCVGLSVGIFVRWFKISINCFFPENKKWSLWIAHFKIADSKYFCLIVLWAFESFSLFNEKFDSRPIKSLLLLNFFTLLPFVKICFTDVNRDFTIEMNNSWIVSWRFKFYGLCHLIVKLRFNVIETNLYGWKVLNAIQQYFDAIVFK